MKLNLTLYTNMFQSSEFGGTISAAIVVWEGDTLISMHAAGEHYPTDRSFRCALAMHTVARDVRGLLEKLGHEVTADAYLDANSTLTLGDELQRRVDMYEKSLPVAALVDVADLEDAE
jgi:hypothetical protein